MPPKKSLPAPIDRPLSRAYLREFKGWSTAYPPGVSDPTSLRVMENVFINRDGAAVVRPGLRAMTRVLGTEAAGQQAKIVGTMEPFYLEDGRRAYLFAARRADDGKVYFQVMVPDGNGVLLTYDLWEPPVSMDITGWRGGVIPHFTASCTYVKYVQIDNKILALANNGEPFIVFHVGAVKKAVDVEKLTVPKWGNAVPAGESSKPYMAMPRYEWITTAQGDAPLPASTYYDDSLISSDPAKNVYNFGFFFTYTNELGESESSDIGLVRTQRPFGSWKMENYVPGGGLGTDAAVGNGSAAVSPQQSCDLLMVRFNPDSATGLIQAIDKGATGLNLWMLTWSNQDSVPVEAVLIGQKTLTASSNASNIWFVLNPATLPLERTKMVPNETNRINTTGGSSAAQGIVAADRLVLVNDKTAAGVIRWTTNEQGNYLNFNPDVGGGFKTLTSGNMQVPACVKLWQNPQSADTLTILCMGTDGESTAYYMAPASVTSQSDNTVIMGFEQTTATPGTVSPYGCEVANNALYHPLDDQLMKSTASNYNITHKSMTDQISNSWQRLVNKDKIVSCFFDQRLYFLVHNPDGAALEAGCNGNEVWVLDLAAEGGTWSRWLTQGVSLRKLEDRGRVLLSLLRPEGVYVFDEKHTGDDRVDLFGTVTNLPIAWKFETNTQGANRAHDAWAHLRQVGVTFGNFTGVMKYGIRGQDMHGKWREVEKVYHQHEHTLGDGRPFDAMDALGVARELQEWFFFAESLPDQHSFGQLAPVQYRYTPVSVNVGYAWGEVETFEYGAAAAGQPTVTDNGVPQPYLDTSRT